MKCTWSLILKELVRNFKLVIKIMMSLMSRMYMKRSNFNFKVSTKRKKASIATGRDSCFLQLMLKLLEKVRCIANLVFHMLYQECDDKT